MAEGCEIACPFTSALMGTYGDSVGLVGSGTTAAWDIDGESSRSGLSPPKMQQVRMNVVPSISTTVVPGVKRARAAHARQRGGICSAVPYISAN
jgi:hypothetical protein